MYIQQTCCYVHVCVHKKKLFLPCVCTHAHLPTKNLQTCSDCFFFSFSSPNFYSLSFSLSTPSSSYIIKNGITSYFSVSLSLCLFFSSLLFFSSQQQIQTLTPQSTPGASVVPSSSQPVPLGTSQQVRQPVLNILHGQFLKQTCDSFKFTVS